MPRDSWPLDSVAHVRAALHRLDRAPRDQWPRILGAAVGYGLMPPRSVRDLLGIPDPVNPGSCMECGCGQLITCPDCGRDACAECWACVTDGCGQKLELST